jgi:hypothetical protein
VVETNSLDLDLKLDENGHRLTRDELQNELGRLQQLAQNPSEQQKQRRAEKEDLDKAHELMKTLQPAYIYHVESVTEDEVVLNFEPDPSYKPKSHIATVFHAIKRQYALIHQLPEYFPIPGVHFCPFNNAARNA